MESNKTVAMKTTTLLFVGLLCSAIPLQAQLYTLNSGNLPAGVTGPSTMDVESVDVDDDGDLDLILAMEFYANILLFNDGTGQFSVDPEKSFPEFNLNDTYSGEDSEDIGLADFDMDGDIDVLFVSEDSPYHELLLNDGSGKFTFAPYQFPGSVANALAILDLNADAVPDVLIGNNGQNQAYINNGSGAFSPAPSGLFPANTDQTQDLKVVDIDLDGDFDLIEGIELGGNNIYLNHNGTFEAANDRLPDFQATLETRKVAVGDIDSDGDPDLFFCNVGWVSGADMQDRLLLNDGTGYFEDATERLQAFTAFTLDALIQDLNGDGHMDLVTTGLGTPGTTGKAYLNDGNNYFEEATLNVLPLLWYSGGIGLHSADFNQDGAADLYFSNHGEPDHLCLKIAPVATAQVATFFQLQLAPNPATDSIRVTLPAFLLQTEILDIEIWSMDGKKLQSFQTESPADQDLALNISALPSGKYLLRIPAQEQAFQGSFVIQR